MGSPGFIQSGVCDVRHESRTGEHAVPFLVVERAGSGPLGAMLAQHTIGFGVEVLAPLGIGLLDLAHVLLTFPKPNVGDHRPKVKPHGGSKLRVN